MELLARFPVPGRSPGPPECIQGRPRSWSKKRGGKDCGAQSEGKRGREETFIVTIGGAVKENGRGGRKRTRREHQQKKDLLDLDLKPNLIGKNVGEKRA